MRRFVLVAAVLVVLLIGSTEAQSAVQVSIAADLDPNSATGIRIEGLVADRQGRLYTVDLDSRRFFRITPDTGAVEVLATLPRPGSGMAFDSAGNLYMASTDVILRIAADKLGASTFDPAADVQTFATGVPGANGLAFDSAGNLYVSGGNTGTIYVVAPDGSARTFVSGFVSDRQDQRISTNGLQFGPGGGLYSANTGSGAIDRITINADGSAGPVERVVTSQLLLGADGIAFAENGDLYVAANERNAIVRVSPDRVVEEVAVNTNAGPLEFPASLAFAGTSLYASNFDIPRGANAPGEPGIGASIARLNVGIAGLPLPFVAAPPVSVPESPTPEPVATLPAAPAATPTSAPVPAQPAPTVAPPPAGGPVALPDTGTPAAVPWLPLVMLAVLITTTGFVLRRRRSAR